MITLQSITIRNFLSTGQVDQTVSFVNKDLTLIIGENLDLGGNNSRNGVGKTTLIQAISYALFGAPINNIRKDNLINRTNGKNMLVTLVLYVNGIEYKIERGRKPNTLKFYVNDVQTKTTEDQQGENKETQTAIEKLINMSHDMFKHIVALNTYSEPFLALKSNDQKDIIEQLMGITQLSEKAETVKELIRKSKDSIQQEEFRVKAVEEANKRVREQIDALKRRQTLWIKKHDDDLTLLALQYDELSKIDIESELLAHEHLSEWNKLKQAHDTYNALVARSTAWQQKNINEISLAEKAFTEKNKFDITSELVAWSNLKKWLIDEAVQKSLLVTIDTQTKYITKEKKLIEKLERELDELNDHRCYACGQDFHDDKHLQVTADKTTLLQTAIAELAVYEGTLLSNQALLMDIGSRPRTLYASEAEAIRHSSEVANLRQAWTDKEQETNPFSDQLTELSIVELPVKPTTHYDTEVEAVRHSGQIANILAQIDTKVQESDPYSDQLREMEIQAIQVVNFDKINELTKTMEHQKFLLDLLTSKDSFVRKKIIDQNLSHLNARLTHYLDQIGMPHQVVFKNDLTVEITELGRPMDFHNMSRGEMNRVILSLSWAFRDVWESLYSSINVMFIDELLDNGTDGIGVENSLAILKDMCRRRQKSIWLVSHREDLITRVPSILKVVKEHGFTTYDTVTDGLT